LFTGANVRAESVELTVTATVLVVESPAASRIVTWSE